MPTPQPSAHRGGTAGLNHPILGVTPIVMNTWYHAAVTYDGNKWQLFLNGTLERELVVGRLPRWDNASPAGLGTSHENRRHGRRAFSTARWTKCASGTMPARRLKSARR